MTDAPISRHGSFKNAGEKLVIVEFDERDGTLTGVRVSGDFFLEPDETLDMITEALEGLPTSLTALDFACRVRESLPDHVTMLGVSPESIGIAVRRALTEASRWRDLEWQIVRTPMVSPVLNVALDEVLVGAVGAGLRGPTLRIWEWNEDAVVIGSFQSVRNEVDERAAEATGTTIIRRISGGGAMYMQPQASITYSIVVPTEFVTDLSFEASYAFLDEWVLEALALIGIAARYEALNDITGPSGKIGGAAQKRLASGALLHHVTMAYDMDAERMTQILRIGREKLSDKGTVSAAKRVDPLKTQTGLAREEIIDRLVTVFTQRHGASEGAITDAEWQRAHELVESKFTTPEWTRRIP